LAESYIDNDRYKQITDRTDDAEDLTLQRASMLLDNRCGLDNHATSDQDDDLLLIDYDNLNARQTEAVDQWVAWMTASLIDNDGSVDSMETISLGRFSVEESDDHNEYIPDQLKYADVMIKKYGLIRRDIRSHPNSIDYDEALNVIAIN
jgi:hypothetical protein